MEHIDTVVVGAGVVGLSAALAVAKRRRSVCVLEREPRAGLGTSTHNSQVIHAGIYYPPGSLKGTLCVEGAERLYAFCEAHGVPHQRCGKLIVAETEADVPALERLHARGTANGARGLELVDRTFIRSREPNVEGKAALFSPATGILDAEALVRTLARLCAERDAFLLPGSELVGAEPRADGMLLRTASESIVARAVINAAGLYADTVSALCGGERFTIHPCRGEYAEVVPSRRHLVNALVYPVPHEYGQGLGVHLTKTTAGNLTVGPTARYVTRKDDYEGDRLELTHFVESARRLVPTLRPEDLRLGGTGIRPKLHPAEVPFADFRIARDVASPRLIHAAGIESPGLTACLAIGERAAELVEDVLSP